MTALHRLVGEDAVGQLVRRDGAMAVLGSEGGTVRLDWVDEPARLLADPAALASVETIARRLWDRGVRRVIWSGMGGSVLTVHVLTGLGIGAGDAGRIAVYPLDSTDPAAVDALSDRLGPQRSLRDTHLVAVSMGITSEEPISHVDWYLGLLATEGLVPAEHVTVLTVPGSYLEAHATAHALSTGPVHLGDRSGFPGRMSAPGTLVFLLAVALHTAGDPLGTLHAVLDRAWRDHDLAGARSRPAEHPFVRLAAELSDASVDGCCRLLLSTPDRALLTWIEQVLEQSLGKGGKGVAVFAAAEGPLSDGMLRVRVSATTTDEPGAIVADGLADPDPVRRLAALATHFLGWQLCAAMYGYLHGICVVDEPAVEVYKAHTRRLRELPDPFTALDATAWPDRVLRPGNAAADAVATLLAATVGLSYLDVTVNGEPGPATWERLERRVRTIGDLLRVPVKLRRAPAAYHVSEQSEMDGPGPVVSIRTACIRTAAVRRGTYADRFLPAQGVATWQAMNERGRPCYLLFLDDHDDLDPFLGELANQLAAAKENS